VYASGKRWQAQIRYNGKQHSLGGFDTKEEAALEYDRAARQLGKERHEGNPSYKKLDYPHLLHQVCVNGF
jgi:hypothetical protein